MTTNVFDGNSKVMATDSRWSIEYGYWILYLDDTGFEKIERHNGTSLMFAGHGKKIQEYKNWIRSNPSDFSKMPGVKGMAVCMVDESTGKVTFKKNEDIEYNNVVYAGSGSRIAYTCWSTNQCSIKAVESAKSKDYYSGGEVKYVDFTKNKTNLNSNFPSAEITIEQISANIIERGLAMKISTTPTGTPNLQFAANTIAANDIQPPRDEMAKLLASGELSATAPCDGMHNEWTNEEENNFKAALGKMFGWNS